MGNRFSKKSKGEKKKKNKKEESSQEQPHQENGTLSPPSAANVGESSSSAHLHKVRVKALYNFNGKSEDDLPFEKGDLLEVDESLLAQQNDWWYATHLSTSKVGYIPGNYVTKDDSTPQSQEWWFKMDRREADKVLLLPGKQSGTFLVRDTKEGGHFALSVLAIDQSTQEPCVRHYRIKKMDDGEACYITPSRTFNDLIALVEYYKSRESSGLCCTLTTPCPRIRPPVQWRELEVKRDAVRLTSKLGAGCFGEVWKGKFRKAVDVAVKTLKPGTMSSEAFLKEAKIMHKLTHERLVQLFAVVSATEPFFIITELMVNGSLLDFLHSEKGKELKLPHLIEMNEQVAEGMAYLEKQNNIHRDLRAANILVGEQYDVKIADFGLARILEDEIYGAAQNSKFPVKWTAPEAAMHHRFSIKSDVWSFGVLMYEIITLGRTPYPGMSGHEVLRMIDNGGRMEKPRGPLQVPDEYYDMMLKCWNQNPEDRPTFESVFNFFSDYAVNIEEQYKDVEAA